MRARMLVVAVAAAVASGAYAAPLADVVVVWGADAEPLGPVRDAVADAAARAGASFVDASPSATPLPDPRPLIKRGIAMYAALDFEPAASALDAAVEIVDQTGAHALDSATLGELFIYRGLTYQQRRDETRAWDDLVVAAGVDPARVLDPASFSPSAIERFAQAKAQVAAQPKSRVSLVGGGKCQFRVDGVLTTSPVVELVFGRHWIDATCEGRVPIRRRVHVDRTVLELGVAGDVVAPPDDAALVIQARTASARAIVAVTVQAQIAIARRIGSDGREQDRASVAARDPRDVARLVTRLLVPPATQPKTPWYRSRWTWAIAGAALASAILIPIAATRGGDAPADVVVAPQGMTPW